MASLPFKAFFSVIFINLAVTTQSIFPQAREANPSYFEFIYIDANSGQSSGGHTAVKFGDWVYHFQYYPDEIFHVVRESWFDFRLSYNILENRTLVITKIFPEGISPEFFETGFNKLYLIQEKHLNNEKNLYTDYKLLEFITQKDKNYGAEGIGYLSRKKGSPLLTDLREKTTEMYGKDFFTEKENEIFQKIQNIAWKPNSIPKSRFHHSIYPLGLDSLSRQYNSELQNLAILEIIRDRKHLNPLFLVELPKNHPDFSMTERERKSLVQLKENLETRILEQLNDTNPNHSYIRLLELLTYMVLSESISRNEFLFLDTFTNHRMKVNWVEDRELGEVSKESELIFQKFRTMVFSGRINLERFINLQDSANRFMEIAKSKEGFRPIRYSHSKTLPKKKGMPESYPTLNIDTLTANRFLAITLRNHKEYISNIKDLYPYHLITQNCTSEIFFSFEKFFDRDHKRIENVLGKNINPLKSLAFIPFYADYDIRKNYHKTETYEYLSFRRQKLKDLKGNKTDILLDWKESFVPTSSLYKTNTQDHTFMFFTDDTILMRPIFGIGNFFTGLSVFLWGIPMTPVDRGDRVLDGTKGMFFSLPELVFFNINKGSFTGLKPSDLDPDFPNEWNKKHQTNLQEKSILTNESEIHNK